MPGSILCADDDRHFCQILSRAFEKEGYSVTQAHDGEDALQKIHSLKPDLVTLDVMLPRRDGFDVLESLRSSGGAATQTPVILVSGCTITAEYQARADALAAKAVLQKPVPLAKLLDVVAAHTHSTSSAKKPSVSSKGSRKSALTGTLEELPTEALLHQLHGLRATGVLRVQSGKRKKQVQLREGAPIAVRSNLVQETLGALLLASGKITEDVLHSSLLRVKRGEGLQGQILKAMHMLDEEDLAYALRQQAQEKLLELFAWESASFQFLQGARLKGANALTLKTSPANIVWRGIQKRTPIHLIDRFLATNAEKTPFPGESAFYNYQDVQIGEDAAAWRDRLDGSETLGDLGPLNEADRRQVYGLVVLDLLELRAAKAPTRKVRPRQIREVQRKPIFDENRGERAPQSEEDIGRELTEMASKLRDQDYFVVLEVDRNATDDDVRDSYAKLAKRTHPDRFSGASEALIHLAEEVFGYIAQAYETIGDREKRLKYLRQQQGQDKEQQELEVGQRALQAELEFQKGATALASGAVDAALGHFSKAVDTYPEEGEYLAYFGWARYLVETDEPDRIGRAISVIEKGRKLAPEREKPYLFLGRLCQAKGREDVAEKMFMRAVQLDPDSLEALRELRLINMRREKSKSFVSKILRRR